MTSSDATASGALLGTLGGPTSFAGQATFHAFEAYPSYDEIVYFPTTADVWDAMRSGDVAASVVTGETSHFINNEAVRKLATQDDVYVIGNVVVPYRCTLWGKPGASISDIVEVRGHGSLRQCRAFLERELPGVPAHIHVGSSEAAAQEVAEADGTIAVVATLAAGRSLGLEILAEDVDEGSEGGWWLVTNQRPEQAEASTVYLSVRPSARLGDVLERARASEMHVRSLFSLPTGTLFDYAHLVVLEADGDTAVDAVEQFGDLLGCRLVGWF